MTTCASYWFYWTATQKTKNILVSANEWYLESNVVFNGRKYWIKHEFFESQTQQVLILKVAAFNMKLNASANQWFVDINERIKQIFRHAFAFIKDFWKMS